MKIRLKMKAHWFDSQRI